MSGEEYELPEPHKIEGVTLFPRFILPDFLAREYLNAIEEQLARERHHPDSIQASQLAALAEKLKEHLKFQESLVHSGVRGVLALFHNELNKVVGDDLHDKIFHGGSNAEHIRVPNKELKDIPPLPKQVIGTMQHLFDPDYADIKPGEKSLELPGVVIDPNSDPIAKIVFENAQAVYQYYREVHQRDSLDNKHMTLVSSIHFGKKYANAFWSDEDSQMVYGDGDPLILKNIAESLDVAGHEMTHGLISKESRLEYQTESGALNESAADVFGLMVKQWKLKQTFSTADWLVGPDTVPFGKALRSFKAETANNHDLQPKNIAELKEKLKDSRFRNVLRNDQGGVHILSGIPNHAYYLFVQSLGPDTKAYELPAKVWYATLTSGTVRPRSSFKEFATITVKEAEKFDLNVAHHLHDAWVKVGVLV